MHGNTDDRARGLNRTENLRPIPTGDPDFERLYLLRNDAESINRHLDDTLYLRRAHSLGHQRHLRGFALSVNSRLCCIDTTCQNSRHVGPYDTCAVLMRVEMFRVTSKGR